MALSFQIPYPMNVYPSAVAADAHSASVITNTDQAGHSFAPFVPSAKPEGETTVNKQRSSSLPIEKYSSTQTGIRDY